MSNQTRIAAVITEYFAGSHADVVVTKFLKGFPTDEGRFPPRVDLVSMYIDQFTEDDIGRAIAAEHDVPIYPSIVKALTLGGEELAVDGVLLIGEHGDYAWNEKEQQLFPRKYFMEQICGVIATSGRPIPIFSDKHLSYNWHDAKWMTDRARELSLPFMAGSSLPVVWRNPWLEHDRETDIQEVAADKGYHKTQTIAELSNGRGLRTYIPEREQKGRRRWTNKPTSQQAAFYANRRRIRGDRGKRLQRRRSEYVERTFAHMCQTGGGRRTWLRGLEDVRKRWLIQAAARNLGLILRKLFGVGTARSLQKGAGLLCLLYLALDKLSRLAQRTCCEIHPRLASVRHYVSPRYFGPRPTEMPPFSTGC